MSFKVLYIDDNPQDRKKVEEAINPPAEVSVDGSKAKANRAPDDDDFIELLTVASPEEARKVLGIPFDLVLADVFFGPAGKDRDRLDEIIEIVRSTSGASNKGRTTPIIAYTRRGRKALESLLERGDALYDIWDKHTASPPYVAWRLSQLAMRLVRERPDARLQREIRTMKSSVSWHVHVVEMAQGYHAGWNERDQVERAGASIETILNKLGTWVECERLWGAVKAWEPISRSIAPKARGHARHVINVFWLGYLILCRPELDDWVNATWDGLISQRSDSGEAKALTAAGKLDPREALVTAWLYAALFHDVGGCVEKMSSATNALNDAAALCGPLGKGIAVSQPAVVDLAEASEGLVNGFKDPLRKGLLLKAQSTAAAHKPDQGLVSGVCLMSAAKTDLQKFLFREAARAAALHNLLPEMLSDLGDGLISWSTEPIGSLLILCDQLQTWDRERGDETIISEGQSERAELAEFRVETTPAGPKVFLGIEYIAPGHVLRRPEALEAERARLQKVLKDKPGRALRGIASPWPFTLDARFSLSGVSLDTPVICD